MIHSKRFSIALTAAFAFVLFGCGSKFTGTYALNQQGAQFSSMQGCSQINLSINDSGGQLSGYGQNQCFSEQISGTSSGGQANVTLTVQPAGSAGGYTGYGNGYNNGYGYNGYGSSGMCAYQGVLTISGNSVSGTLMPVSQSGGFGNCSGQVMITGTKN
ncbi:MAG: hypothetical protein EBX52_01640 [Proteobacteria bacterium]|nr:hypothetical protein [Pseudomonadota bacterium]